MHLFTFIKNFLRRFRRPVADIEQRVEAGHNAGQEQQSISPSEIASADEVGLAMAEDGRR